MRDFKISFYALCSRLLDKRMLFLLVMGIVGGIVSSWSGWFFLGFIHYTWYLVWRRWVAFFIVLESQQSPASLVVAFYQSMRSFLNALPLTLWYAALFFFNVIVIFKLEWFPEWVGLYLIGLYIALEVMQFGLDLLLYPLIADGYVHMRDLIYGSVHYLKEYWLSILGILITTGLLTFIILYLGAIVLFLLHAPLVFFEEFAYFLFFFTLTATLCLFYVQVHYKTSARD